MREEFRDFEITPAEPARSGVADQAGRPPAHPSRQDVSRSAPCGAGPAAEASPSCGPGVIAGRRLLRAHGPVVVGLSLAQRRTADARLSFLRRTRRRREAILRRPLRARVRPCRSAPWPVRLIGSGTNPSPGAYPFEAANVYAAVLRLRKNGYDVRPRGEFSHLIAIDGGLQVSHKELIALSMILPKRERKPKRHGTNDDKGTAPRSEANQG